VARRTPLRTQELQDVSGFDAEILGELLDFDTACRGGYL
jgi:hypothetical protein